METNLIITLVWLLPLIGVILGIVFNRRFVWINRVWFFLTTLLEIIAGFLILTGDSPDKLFAMGGLSVIFVGLALFGMFLSSFLFLSNLYSYNGIFFSFLHILLISVIGIFHATDLFVFFFSWEMMSLSIYYFIVFSKSDQSFKAGKVYLLISAFSAFTLLFAIGYTYFLVGSIGFDAIFKKLAEVTIGKKVFLFILFSVPFLTKMAIMPLHPWAPAGYDESENNFTGLFSGILSKLGVYGLILFSLLIFGEKFHSLDLLKFRINGLPLLSYILALMGVLTAVFGTFYAILQEDIKKLLAYSSLGQLGYILTGFALFSPMGFEAALVHTINHAVFKMMLFFTVAGVIARTGIKKLYELGGLITNMPFSFLVVLLAIITLAGIPPLSGFASKWFLYEALIEKHLFILAGLAFLASTSAFLYCYRIIYSIFLGQPNEKLKDTEEVPLLYMIPTAILMVFTVVFGMFPQLFVDILNPIVVPIFGKSAVSVSNGVLVSSIGRFSGLSVMNTVGISFIFFLLFISFGFVKARKVSTIDIHTSAEPVDSDTPLHYSYNFYLGFKRSILPVLNYSVTTFYKKVLNFIVEVFDFVRGVYSGNAQVYIVYILVFSVFLILILGGF